MDIQVWTSQQPWLHCHEKTLMGHWELDHAPFPFLYWRGRKNDNPLSFSQDRNPKVWVRQREHRTSTSKVQQGTTPGLITTHICKYWPGITQTGLQCCNTKVMGWDSRLIPTGLKEALMPTEEVRAVSVNWQSWSEIRSRAACEDGESAVNSRDGPALQSWDLALCPNLPKLWAGSESGFCAF